MMIHEAAARMPRSLPVRGWPFVSSVAALLLAGCTIERADPEGGSTAGREAVGAQPDLPYSEAVRVGQTFYFAGKVGANDSTRALAEGRTAAETRNVLDAFRGAFDRLGLQFTDVVNANVYLTNIDDFAEMNAVYREYFPVDPPARTTVGVAALPGGAVVEISLVVAR
jgi:2-iminobutanoate/2-iminopropanoate deaminase